RIDLLVSNGIGHFKGCGIEAHQNGVLFRMLTYCVVQRRADLLLQPLKNLRCSLPLLKRTVPVSPWWLSGRILACHAGGPGSIPGQCSWLYFCPFLDSAQGRRKIKGRALSPRRGIEPRSPA